MDNEEKILDYIGIEKNTLKEILKGDISFKEGNYFLLNKDIDRNEIENFVKNNMIEKIDSGWRVVLNKAEDKQK